MIGAGQAGLSTAYFLRRRGLVPGRSFVVLDHSHGPGGAWQHRWPSLRLGTTNHVHDLPGLAFQDDDEDLPAAVAVSAYFAEYERRFALDVRRPVSVRAVRHGTAGRLLVETDDGAWAARAVVNASGTWDRPFWPSYPGAASFRGRQLHTADYRGADVLAGRHVVVVGGGISAVQHLAEISAVTGTTWVTRRPPRFTHEPFTHEVGRRAVAEVEARVRRGLPPGSVVSATGLMWTPQLLEARDRGALERRPMFSRITPDGVAWEDGTEQPADVILWATGFRPVVDHLAPLRLREAGGGIRVDGTTAVREPRLQLVGYGPSASTVGATRAGRSAAAEVARLVEDAEQAAA